MKTPLLAAGLAFLVCTCRPVQAQEREWILDAADEDAFLVFGVPETDDVGVSFWCKLGSGRMKIFFPEGSPELEPDTTADFTVLVGGKSHTLSGKTTANAMSGATSVEAEISIDDPMILELEKADRFEAKVGKHDLTFPLIDAGLENLLKLCRTK